MNRKYQHWLFHERALSSTIAVAEKTRNNHVTNYLYEIVHHAGLCCSRSTAAKTTTTATSISTTAATTTYIQHHCTLNAALLMGTKSQKQRLYQYRYHIGSHGHVVVAVVVVVAVAAVAVVAVVAIVAVYEWPWVATEVIQEVAVHETN